MQGCLPGGNWVIRLNGTKEGVEVLLKSRMEEVRLRAKMGKKTKEPKVPESVSKSGVSEEAPGPSKMKTGKPEDPSLDSREKKTNSAPKSAAAPGSALEKAPRGPSLAAKSQKLMSLFTTHSSAKPSKEESAHRVTHTSYCV